MRYPPPPSGAAVTPPNFGISLRIFDYSLTVTAPGFFVSRYPAGVTKVSGGATCTYMTLHVGEAYSPRISPPKRFLLTSLPLSPLTTPVVLPASR